jgi:hypothetical protein
VTVLVRVKPRRQRSQQLVALFGGQFFFGVGSRFHDSDDDTKVNQFGEQVTSRAINSPERGSVTRSNHANQGGREIKQSACQIELCCGS